MIEVRGINSNFATAGRRLKNEKIQPSQRTLRTKPNTSQQIDPSSTAQQRLKFLVEEGRVTFKYMTTFLSKKRS